MTPAVNDLANVSTAPSIDWRGVLRHHAFRRLLVNIAVSSLGDWLGLLAQTALASALVHSSSGQVFAIGGVLIVRFVPALLFGPIAGAFADRFDRRQTMVVCDVLRFALFLTIPLVSTLSYLYIASFLVECVGLFWIPAKEAAVPNLLPPEELETANTLSLMATYGTGAVAAGVFTLLSLLTRVLAAGIPFFHTNPVDLSLYFDAGTFLFSAVTVWRLREIRGVRRHQPGDPEGVGVEPLGIFKSIMEGWRFIGDTPLIRGLAVGILGAFAAAGAVIALGRPYVGLLHAGNAAYGLLFGAVFFGLAVGMATGPRLPHQLSRRRLFGPAIVGAGASLMVTAVLPNLVLALLFVAVVATFAGVAWVVGYTMLGLEVADEVRGRTFALVQSLVRVDLLAVLAIAPFVAGAIGRHSVRLPNHATIRADGVTIVLFCGGLVAIAAGVYAFRKMDDRAGVPLLKELWAGVRGRTLAVRPPGFFIAVEGGDGAGKSTQVVGLTQWLRSLGHEVVLTREPGDTPVGQQLRSLLLDPRTRLSPRTEALLYAADRAQHVDDVIMPALRRGAVVVCDRYVDSSLAYQASGRGLPFEDVAQLADVASAGLVPDLTIVLDVDPAVGLERIGRAADRLEQEGLDFHRRVREGYLALARRAPGRYAVLAADGLAEQVESRIRDAVTRALPDAVATREVVSA
ncbi:MAG: dTMP kinase [Mycobacteriales bacterium]